MKTKQKLILKNTREPTVLGSSPSSATDSELLGPGMESLASLDHRVSICEMVGASSSVPPSSYTSLPTLRIHSTHHREECVFTSRMLGALNLQAGQITWMARL